MGSTPRTKHGYSMYDMSSMLQKACRRSDIRRAAYAANELFYGYEAMLWNRLLTISAEDCYGIMTKEIVALRSASDMVNGKKKDADRTVLFVAKAVTLLCMARKSRDADYVACNFMWPDTELDPNEIEHVDPPDELVGGVPDYTYDCHTFRGRARGKNVLDMIKSEEAALKPKQQSMFDNGSWGPFFDEIRKTTGLLPRTEERLRIFQHGKEDDPTHNGVDLVVR